MLRFLRLAPLLILAVAMASLVADAQPVETDEEVTSIIRSLAPINGQAAPASPTGTITSSAPTGSVVTSAPTPPPAQVVVVQPQQHFEFVLNGHLVVLDRGYSIDMDVFFRLDSADLTQQARETLHVLGRALESEQLRQFSYLISGHTDASGPDSHNQALSERRAQAVRDYLVRNYFITPDRLLWTGFGESQLRIPEEPYSAVNRRVEIALVVERTIAE